MKIRIKGNTIRYRLSKPEVAELSEDGELEEQTEFINGTLLYSIKQTESNALSADFFQNIITLSVPKATLRQWTDTEQVSIDGNMSLPNGNTLYLLLEKDFKCANSDLKEDQSDYFENPNLNC